ncbi:putative RNA-binding protein YciO [Gammaproteobacteria bacterium]
MAQFFQIHPDNPQPRLIRRTVDILNHDGVVVYPTDSSYALGCLIGNKTAMDRIRRIRRLEDSHNFTLICRDLSDLAAFAKVSNRDFRLLKAHTPGPYTFILLATNQVPRRLQHPKRKTIGLRVPAHVITQAILAELNEPLMSVTLIMPSDTIPLTDPYEMRELLNHQVDLVIDGGYCGLDPTTVIELTGDLPVIARRGKGDPQPFEPVE